MIRDGPLIFLGEGGGVRQFFWARFFFVICKLCKISKIFCVLFRNFSHGFSCTIFFQPFFSVQGVFLEISQPLPPPLGPQKNHGPSLNFPSFKLTGSQFWRGSRKILVAKKSQRSYLRRVRGQKKKPTAGDILDRLRKMVSSDAEEEDDFTETPSPEPKQEPKQELHQNPCSCKAKAAVLPLKKMLKKKLLKCSSQYLRARFVLINASYQQQHVPLVMP